MFLACLAIIIAFSFRKNALKAIEAQTTAESQKNEIEQTLAKLMDEDGTVRGQLMLPGKAPDDSVIELKEANKEIKKLMFEANGLSTELKAERKNREDISTVVEFINNDDSVVQIRLPNILDEKNTPNKTPCGALCEHAFFLEADKTIGRKRGWKCAANQGYGVDDSRDIFLDKNNQCVMFEKN